MISYKKCMNCGAIDVKFFPVETVSDQKRGGTVILSIGIIFGMIATITAIASGILFLKNFEIIISSELATFDFDKFSEAMSVLFSWKITTGIFKISGILFLIFALFYKLIPYKRVVRVFSVCQNCGHKMELLDEAISPEDNN